MKRTPLSERTLPNYTRGNEIANMVTHIVGGGIGVLVLLFGVITAIWDHDVWGIVGMSVYGFSMIALYTVSSVYHGLKPCMGKKVMQVIDHCTIYFLIAGTYTPILLSGIRPLYPKTALFILLAEWGLAAVATVFTAIDHRKYGKFSMVCYIGMGWLVVLALKPTLEAVGWTGFWLLFAGGVSYTLGAVLYGVGKKKSVFHSVFHVFVVIGTILQAICIMFYVV